jgi:hypothetical protein
MQYMESGRALSKRVKQHVVVRETIHGGQGMGPWMGARDTWMGDENPGGGEVLYRPNTLG